MTMQCTVRWNGFGMNFNAQTGSGHLVTMDGAPEGGGMNLAARPLELMLAGLGGCTAYDIVLILQRGRHDVTGCEVAMEAERATTEPKVFTKIHLKFKISGHNLKQEAVERAVKLSHEKYCSAAAMLEKTAQMSYEIEVVSL